MREFHLHTFVDGDLHQAMLVSLTRHEEEKLLQIHEICIVTQRGTTQSTTKINMEGLTQVMAQDLHGNIDKQSFPAIKNMFYEMLSEESKNQLDLEEFLDDLQELDETERMLVASEAAMSAHPINQSIEEIVNERLQDPSRDK